jgi:hypothetical protein
MKRTRQTFPTALYRVLSITVPTAFMPAGRAKPVYAPYIEHVPPDTTAAIFLLKNRDATSGLNRRTSLEPLSATSRAAPFSLPSDR